MRTPTTTATSIMSSSVSPSSMNQGLMNNELGLNRGMQLSNSNSMHQINVNSSSASPSGHNLSQHYIESNHQHISSTSNSLCSNSYPIVSNDGNYSSSMNLNLTHHNMQSPNHIYHHHNTTPNQQTHHHQYNYMPLPWITAAAAQLSTHSSFLESFNSSALACGYNSILPHHSYQTSNEGMPNDSPTYHHHHHHPYHNFHK